MKTATLILAGILALGGQAAWSANVQNTKMKTCNAEATEKALKGDERKAFMKTCLSSKPASTLTAQQQRMVDCNKEAKDKQLTGSARKDFVNDCLKTH